MFRLAPWCAALVGLVLAAGPAAAEPPPGIAAALERMGRVINAPATAALYAPLHAAVPREGIRITRDAVYGTDPRHRLDVFAPEAPAERPRPVLVFVHGGGFVAGDKQGPGDSPFYANVGLWAAREGMVGVNMTYRLAPASPYPGAQQDIAAALAWVAANIRAQGGDPNRVFLMGHSAGAIHAAIYAAEPRFRPAGVPPPVAYVFLSGLYEFGGAEVPENERAYFGEDAAQRAVRSPLAGLREAEEPMFLAHAALDPERFVQQAERARAALCDAGRCPTTVALAGHSHMSEVYAIGTADAALTAPLLAFLRR